MQMKVPAEEREQYADNDEFKILLQKLVDSELQLTFGNSTSKYEEIVDLCLNYKPPVVEKEVPKDVQHLMPTPEELQQMMIAQARQSYGSNPS